MISLAREAVERVRAALAALVVDPGVRVERSYVGEPVDAAELARWRGRVPDDLLDVLALVDGLEIVWECEDGDAPGGMLRLPPVHALTVVDGRDGLGYVLVDGRRRGMGSYYRVPAAAAVTPPDVVYTLRGDEPRQAEVVCDSFAEYLLLAARARFAASWTDDVAYQRYRALRERDREAAERAVEALGADAWRAWRDALWGSPEDVAEIAARYDDALVPALIDAGEPIAAGLGQLALVVPSPGALIDAILRDPRARLRRGAIAAWASAGGSVLSAEQLAALHDDADPGVRRAAAAIARRR